MSHFSFEQSRHWLNEQVLPGSGTILYNTCYYGYKFVIGRKQPYSTLAEPFKETITLFINEIR